MIVLSAAIASGLGALSRYVVASAIHRRTSGRWPWGTAAVNVVGALALGLLVGVRGGAGLDADVVTIAGTGFLGGFTTFSSWMVESVHLGQEDAAAGVVAAAGNVVVLLAVGLLGAAIGAGVG